MRDSEPEKQKLLTLSVPKLATNEIKSLIRAPFLYKKKGEKTCEEEY